jgi:hypothetical protein
MLFPLLFTPTDSLRRWNIIKRQLEGKNETSVIYFHPLRERSEGGSEINNFIDFISSFLTASRESF